MSKLPTFKPIQRTDVPDAPKWIERFMTPINDFLTGLQTLLHGQVGTDNENVEIRDIKVHHDQSVELALSKLNGKPSTVWVTPLGYFNYSTYAWEIVDLKRVRIKVFFFNVPAEEITVRVRVEGD